MEDIEQLEAGIGTVRVWLDIGHYRDIHNAIETRHSDGGFLVVSRDKAPRTVFKIWTYLEWIEFPEQ